MGAGTGDGLMGDRRFLHRESLDGRHEEHAGTAGFYAQAVSATPACTSSKWASCDLPTNNRLASAPAALRWYGHHLSIKMIMTQYVISLHVHAVNPSAYRYAKQLIWSCIIMIIAADIAVTLVHGH